MKKIYASLTLLLAASVGAMAEETTVFDLMQQSSFNQCTQTSIRYDHDDYRMWTFSTYYGPYLSNSSIYVYDDYLTTPDLTLNAGDEYIIYTKPCIYNTRYTEWKMNVLLGQGDDLESYRTLAELSGDTYTYNAEVQTIKFQVPETGAYRVSFEGLSTLYLWDTKICDLGPSATPKAPEDFTISPDPDGALNVTVSFTMPTTTLTGQPLEGDLTYTLYRGVQAVKRNIAAAPGEQITFNETRGESGTVTYAVEIKCGEETSEKLSAASYLGPETPSAPQDVVLAMTGNTANLSWTAPEVGTHGATLIPSKLTYNVVRYLDGEASTVAEGLTACHFTETVVPEGLQSLKYAVVAKYATPGLLSAETESAQIRIGSVDMPFADSFAGAVFSPLWDHEIVTQASNYAYPWKVVESCSVPKAEPYDGDGGMAFYNSYNIQKNNSARLITPPMKLEAGANPVVMFAKFNVSAKGNDRLYVQVSCDGGEWINVPGAEYTPNASEGGTALTWEIESVLLADVLPAGTESFRVALYGVSEYGQNFMVDDFRVFNLVEKDLAVASLSITPEVKAGKSATLSLRVSNNGSSDVAADEYSISIDTDYPGELSVGELLAVPSLGSVTYVVDVPVNTLHMLDNAEYSFNVSISYAGDEAPSNNSASEDAVLTASFSDMVGATDFDAVKEEDGSVTLSWTPAKDLDYVPVNIQESFEDPEFAEDSTGPFNGWVTVDIDGKSGGTWYTASGSEFNVARNVSTPSNSHGENKCVLGVTVASNAQQDDWIISPMLNCKASAELRLEMLLALRTITSYGNTYKIELLYTTEEEYSVLNPANAFTSKVAEKTYSSYNDSQVPQDNKFHEVSFEGIPGEARYIALHFCAKGSYTPAMWVDNIRLTEIDNNPLLGYHIYDVNSGTTLNGDELVSSEVASFVLPAPAEEEDAEVATFSLSRPVFVSAVYADGEAQPSNMIDLDAVLTGIDGITVDTTAEGKVRIYNLQGVEMPEASRLTPGVYIRLTGNKAEKISIR